MKLYELWKEHARVRRELCSLAALDDRTLGDIGVTRTELHWGISKPFWRSARDGKDGRR